MIDPRSVPPVADDELLARFVTQSGQYRKIDNTVKQDLFIPNARGEVSVMRHRDATELELWDVAHNVANSLNRKLYGRSDITAAVCTVNGLRVVASPIMPTNPNHADVLGWPTEKEDQKAIAQKLAAAASKLVPPPSSSN
jgi:hypothetical protein